MAKRFAAALVTSVTAIGFTSSHLLHAGEPVDDAKMVKQPLEDYHPMYLGTFNTGVKTSDVYTEGNVSFVVPVWSSLGADGTLGGGMAFITPYVSVGEQGEMAASLGLGWRYLFNDQSVSALKSDAPAGFATEGFYVGANVFVDNLRTHFDNDFWQLGIGAEIGSRYVELRGNYYLPFDGGQKLADRRTDTQTYTTRSTSSSSGTVNSIRADAPIASGNTLQQDAYLTTSAVTATRTTTTRTTVTTVTELYEEGMEGWDLEAAFLIPGIDQYLDVTVLAGYYSFDNQPFGPQRGGSGKTEGFKAGLEIRPVPAIVLTGMWYEDEGLTGSDWVAGIGLQIPLGRDWKDAFKPRRRHLIERLAEPVARQNAAIKTSLSYDQKHDVKQTSSTQTAVTRRVVSQSSQRITIAEDVIFVNNGGEVGNGIEGGSSSGDGTAENPLNTIQAGADLAGNNNVNTQRVWTVYTQGAGVHGGSSYNESVTISASTNFLSSASTIGYAVTGINGTGDRPLVIGGFAANAADFLAGSTTDHRVGIDGYNITGGYQSSASIPQVPVTPYAAADGDGIHLNGLKTFAVVDNRISNTATAVNIQSSAADVVGAITSNILSSNTESGLNLSLIGSNSFTGNILGNTANDNGGSGYNISMIGVNTWNGSFVLNTGNENTFNGATISVDAAVTGNFAANTFNGNDAAGLSWFIANVAGGFYNNSFKDNGTYGLNIGGSVTQGVFNNTISGNLSDGIFISGFGAASISIFNNLIDDNGGHGIHVFGGLIGDIHSNIITNNTGDGLRITGMGDYTGDIWGNIIASNGGSGIYVDLQKDPFFPIFNGTFTGDIYNNAIGSNGSHGIYIKTQGKITSDVAGNQVLNNAGVGIGLETALVLFPSLSFADIESNITDNIVVNNTGGGIGVNSSGNFIGSIADNYSIDNGTSGISLFTRGNVSGDVSGNIISGSGDAGIIISASGSLTGNVSGNEVAESGTDGIHITSVGFIGDVHSNVVVDNAGSGIFIDSVLGFNGDIIDNYAVGNGVYGIHVKSYWSMYSNVRGNTVDGGSVAGLMIYSVASLDGDIHQNTVSNVEGDGIYIGAYEYEYVGDVYENISFNNSGVGLRFFAPFSTLKGDIRDNAFVMNGVNGLEVEFIGGLQGDILNNEVSQNGGHGIILSKMTGKIAGNYVSENGLDGINIDQGPGIYTNLQNIEITDNSIFQNGGSGIVLKGVTDGSIYNNSIHNNGLNGLHIAGKFNGDIYNNEVVENTGHGILIGQIVADPLTPLNFEGDIYGNTTSGNDGNGILINGTVMVTGDIHSNTANGNGANGIAIDISGFPLLQVPFRDFTGNIYNNQMNANTGHGLSVELDGKFTGDIAGNEASSNDGSGIYIYLQYSNAIGYGGEFIGNISGNATHENAGAGISAYSLNQIRGNVFDNEAFNNGVNGISVDGKEGFVGHIYDNQVDGNTSAGIAVGGPIIGNVYGNTSTNNGGHGISLGAQGLVDADIYSNIITGNDGDGIYIATSGGRFPIGIGVANYEGNIYNNVINYNGGTAINTNIAASFIGNVTANQIIGNGAGINIFIDAFGGVIGSQAITGNIQNNVLLNNNGVGIRVFGSLYAAYTGTVSGNYVVNSAGDGIVVSGGALFNTVSVNGNITNNVIAGSGGNGLNIYSAAQMTGNISNNTVSTSAGHGVQVEVGGLIGDVMSNVSIQNQGAGIHFTSNGDVTGNIQSNTTSNNAGSGFIFTEGLMNALTFSGAFSGNTSNLNGGHGFSTDVTTLAPGGGPYSPNTAGGNALGNFNNAGAPVANP